MATEANEPNSAGGRSLRLWPAIIAASLIVVGLLLEVLLTIAMPDAALGGLAGAFVGMLVVFVWWLLFSRVRWSERLGVMSFLIVSWLVMFPFLDKSISGGAMGALPLFGFTIFAVALVVWAAATRYLLNRVRFLSLVPAMLIAAGLCTIVKTSGIRGGAFEFHWRWTPTPEELLLARQSDTPPPVPPASATPEPTKAEVALSEPVRDLDAAAPPPEHRAVEWPGFRGPLRDGVVHNVRIETDWSKTPPVELWRRPIGPGWSSFSVDGDRIYTQEQRGDDEIVAGYHLSTGQPLWWHRDAVRFYESNGGPGPRGTPTINNGRVYALGATGVLNALDERTGAVLWSRDAASDTKTEVPMWGFSSSPLITDNRVIVATGGTLAGYDAASGNLSWVGPERDFSYSSPQLATIGGVPQVLLLAPPGVVSVTPSEGKVLWQHTWEGGAIVQPAVTPDGDVLINSITGMGGQGIRRLVVALKSGQWTAEERWTSNGLKPYFNDFVVHNGHAYGFDGSILSCIDLTDGKRKWKGGRYGAGQLVLLADQNVLLVLSEEGELALVSATPDEFKEIARFKAIEGKTWNHPVLVHDTLLVRNGEEMAAFKLAIQH